MFTICYLFLCNLPFKYLGIVLQGKGFKNYRERAFQGEKMFDMNNATEVLSNAANAAIENTATGAATLLPALLAAIVIFIVGWIVAVVVSGIFASFLRVVKLEQFLKEHRIQDALGSVRISSVLVKILKYYLLLWIISQAFSLLELGTISMFLNSFLLYAPALIGAVLVILLAFLLGEYVKETIAELDPKSAVVVFVARAMKVIIIYVGITTGMSTAGFNTTLLDSIFLQMLSALALGVALAVGIAFGLGGQKDAQELVGSWRKNLKI